jgi:hypothetical protein
MGVDRSDWIVIGANIGMEYYDDEKYEYFDKFASQNVVGEITYIIDGMCGEYFVVGTVIRADDGGYNGLGIFEINPDKTFEKERLLVRNHIKEHFGLDVAPKLIVLTHFS